jgi:hypothetical protein
VTPLRQRMLEELQRRNFAPTTIRGYIRTVWDFAAYFHKQQYLKDCSRAVRQNGWAL